MPILESNPYLVNSWIQTISIPHFIQDRAPHYILSYFESVDVDCMQIQIVTEKNTLLSTL